MPEPVQRNASGIPHRTLGRTGLPVSIIGLGGGHLSRPHVSEADAVRVVRTAIDYGVTFMDNAWEYWEGESERRMGIAIEGRRDQVVVMTKVCGRDRQTAEDNLHDSLRRLRTDVIDIWQFHEINYDNDPEWIFAPGGAIEAADAAKKAGKIRFVGFTGHKSPHILSRMLDKDFPWDTCQLPVNVLDAHYRSFQKQILPELKRRGIGAIAMKSLGGEGQLVTRAGLTARQCRRYALSCDISTLVCGIESLENLQQDVEIAKSFTTMTLMEMTELAERFRDEAGDGRHEWCKSTQHHDSKYHREQHGFPAMDELRR